MKFYEIQCYTCGRVHQETESVTSCLSCSGPLETYYDYEKIAERLNIHALKTSPISSMKYVPFYPIENLTKIFSLQEGGTPLIHAKRLGKPLGLNNLYIKNEGLNPTGVFKDRGTMVEITKARELGAQAVCLASTGNMAASVAAYCSVVDIPCYILVPEGTPIGKLSQTLSFGARVIQVRTDYSECARLAARMSKEFGYYLAGDYTFRAEGQKSLGYEVSEQLFWKSPDYLVCPVGLGTNMHAIYKGFKEFHTMGFIDRVPRMIAVQTPGCNPIVSAFQSGRRDYDIYEKPNTVASAISASDPLDGVKVLDDLYESHGTAVEVTDEFLLEMQQEQAREGGVFAEPSGSLAYAAVRQLAGEGYFNADDVIVCVATGNGLKDPKSPLRILAEPASVEPNFSEIEHFIKNKLFALKETGQKNPHKKIFVMAPENVEEVRAVIKQEFGIDTEIDIALPIFDNIQHFIQKGKEIYKSDLQSIIEDAFDTVSQDNRVLEVRNFSISTGLNTEAEATVEAIIFGNTVKITHKGVGPVDAAIKAIKKGLSEFDTRKVRLTDYEVAIPSGGVDATVEVKMTLYDKFENKVIALSASPDVIVASIRAYEKGINILYAKNDVRESHN